MSNKSDHPTEGNVPGKWQGLAELDQALAENRLTEYRIRKAWADPIERRLTIAIAVVVVAVFGYLAFSSLMAN